jgi:hypothetical protein
VLRAHCQCRRLLVAEVDGPDDDSVDIGLAHQAPGDDRLVAVLHASDVGLLGCRDDDLDAERFECFDRALAHLRGELAREEASVRRHEAQPKGTLRHNRHVIPFVTGSLVRRREHTCPLSRHGLANGRGSRVAHDKVCL